MPVVGAGELDDDAAAGGGAGDAHRAHRRLGAGDDEADLLAARHARGDALGQVHLRRRGQPEDQAAAGGGDHGLLDLGMGVAEERRPPGPDVVDERAARRRRGRARRAAEVTAIGSQCIAAKARTGEWTPPGRDPAGAIEPGGGGSRRAWSSSVCG